VLVVAGTQLVEGVRVSEPNPQRPDRGDMMRMISRGVLMIVAVAVSATGLAAADPLPSWQDGATKTAIMEFVAKVTKDGGTDFVPPAERIATFDNDGTLWAEQPMYFQLLFALDRVKALAPQHPEWKDKEPFASVLKGDVRKALNVLGMIDDVYFRHVTDVGVTGPTLDLQVIEPALKKNLTSSGRLEDTETAVVAGLRLYMRF
jgi:hypothetical protein